MLDRGIVLALPGTVPLVHALFAEFKVLKSFMAGVVSLPLWNAKKLFLCA
jgi:hypothetical protein